MTLCKALIVMSNCTTSACSTGKKEAGIKGFGLSSAMVNKLLRAHSSLDGILRAAEAGDLVCTGPKADAVFGSESLALTAARLRRNWALFGPCSDPKVLAASVGICTSALTHLKERRSRQLDVLQPSHAVHLAWLHPRNQWHWSAIGMCAKVLASELDRLQVPHLMQHALSSGLVVDIAIPASPLRLPLEPSVSALHSDGIQQQPPRLQHEGSPLQQSFSGVAMLLVQSPVRSTDSSADAQPSAAITALQGWQKHHQTLLRRAGWHVEVVECNGSMVSEAERLAEMIHRQG